MAIKERFWQVVRWKHFFLCVIVVVSLGMHFAIINNPVDTVLDEIHYVEDARRVIDEARTERVEHPPLGKLFIAAGIKLFGDNAFGWRFFPVMLGTATIVFFYLLCRWLKLSPLTVKLATFLFAFENMTFTHASITMLDVYLLAFMMLSFMLYAGRHWVSSGVALALSGLSKLTGVMAGPVMAIHWLFSREGRSKWFMLTVIFAIVMFFVIMIFANAIIVREFSAFVDPIERTNQMLSLSGTLTFENVDHPALTRPWEWLFNYTPMAYYLDPHYNGAISFTVWALAIPTFIYMVVRAWKRHDGALFGAAWFFCTWVLWIPLSLITDRSSYPFYFLPAVGAICLGMGMWMTNLLDIFRNRRRGKLKWGMMTIVIFILLVHIFSFVVLSPVFNYDYSWFLAMIV